ncbi:MAG: IclR family transcriptional regulator [Streptosporangiales bacterium]
MAEQAARNNSSSVRRALRILGMLAETGSHSEGVSLAELADGLAMNKSTVLRLVRPLMDEHLLARSADGRYRLGVQALVLGQAYLEGLDLRETAHDELSRLVAVSEETGHLVIYDRPDVVYVDKLDSPNTVRMVSRIGARMPAYCTAVGKVFLAHAAADEVDAVVAAGMPARTPSTLTTKARLASELTRVRDAGYAIDDEENEQGIRCVAAPIRDHLGSVTSAISVSGPAMRMTTAKLAELAPTVVEAGDRISRRLGAGVRGRP